MPIGQSTQPGSHFPDKNLAASRQLQPPGVLSGLSLGVQHAKLVCAVFVASGSDAPHGYTSKVKMPLPSL